MPSNDAARMFGFRDAVMSLPMWDAADKESSTSRSALMAKVQTRNRGGTSVGLSVVQISATFITTSSMTVRRRSRLICCWKCRRAATFVTLALFSAELSENRAGCADAAC